MKQRFYNSPHCIVLGAFFLTYVWCGLEPALAGDISNLSGKDQTIEIKVVGGYQPVTIVAGETYHGSGETQMRYKGGSEITIHYNEEYAIWPGDQFGPQELINRGFGNTLR